MQNFKRNTAEHAATNSIEWSSANPENFTGLQLHEKLISAGKGKYFYADNPFQSGFLSFTKGKTEKDASEFYLTFTKSAQYWLEGWKVAKEFYSQNSTI